MKARDEATIGEFFNETGHLPVPALASEWVRPARVELADGALRIWSTRPYWSVAKPCDRVRSKAGLLESFLALGYPSGETVTLGSLLRRESIVAMQAASHEKIQKFASRYGGLEVFCRYEGGTKWPETLHVEYCDVWQYFANAVGATLRIAASFHAGGSGSKEDWYAISKHPPVMRELVSKSEGLGPLNTFTEGDEEAWLSVAYFAGKGSQRTEVMLSHLVNILLGLGRVRPWIMWPKRAGRGSSPRTQYTSSSLFSNVALQLWLLVSKADAFAVCSECWKQYIPRFRAPKAGQRSFCPECREQGAPKRHALRDFRRRQATGRMAGNRDSAG